MLRDERKLHPRDEGGTWLALRCERKNDSSVSKVVVELHMRRAARDT